MSDKVTEFEWKLRAIKNLAPNCSFSTDNDGKLDWGNGNPLDEPSETKINEETEYVVYAERFVFVV